MCSYLISCRTSNPHDGPFIPSLPDLEDVVSDFPGMKQRIEEGRRREDKWKEEEDDHRIREAPYQRDLTAEAMTPAM